MSDQLPLTCAAPNKRPVKTEAMRKEAAEIIIARMVEYGWMPESDAADAVSDLVRAAEYETDGYRIARRLDGYYHWDCDMEMVEMLNEFGGILDKIYDAAERNWAAENPQEPKFADGAVVTWRGMPAAVHGVCEYRPHCYKVRQGDMGNPTSYFVVPFEDVS